MNQAPDGLPREGGRGFLLVRRGIPLALGVAGLLAALFEPVGRGWYLLLGLGCFAEVWPTFKSGEDYLRSRPASIRHDGAWVGAFRPLARVLGREEAWLLSFFAWNNRKLREHFEVHPARKPLVLLPHCIQAAHCRAQVLDGLDHCFACGRCSVGDLLPSLQAQAWDCRIANRSHKAYHDARAFAPDLILAVSCSDRLVKGLLRLPEVPSYVIPLQLPHGMCVDTSFSVPHLEAAMAALAEPRRDAKVQPLQRQAGA